MISFPNGKINLGLNIIKKRSDGFHDLETIFHPLPLRDVLEILPAEEFRFKGYGIEIPGHSSENLCVRAYQLLKKDFPGLPPLSIHLYKKIPMGAGLGGGSADGAFALALINRLAGLGLSEAELSEYAIRLGSDCPFFLLNKPCFARGRGEILEPIDLDLANYSLALAISGIHVSTAWAFSQIRPAQPLTSLKSLFGLPVSEWRGKMVNDFEEPVYKAHPQLREIRDAFYEAGASYAAMTGSGSTIYGIFEKNQLPAQRFLAARQLTAALVFIP